MKKINKKDWRFCSQRQRMSPFPNYMSMEAMCRQAKKYIGLNVPHILMLMQDRIFSIFIPAVEFEQIADKMVERIAKDSKLCRRLVAIQHKNGKKLVEFAKKSFHADVSKFTNRQLVSAYETYEKLYKEVYAGYGHVWIVEDALNKKLLEIVQKRIIDFAAASDTLNQLTLQPEAMVARIEREHLYAMAAKIIRNKLKSKAVEKLIKQHERRFFWLTRDYDDPILDYDKIAASLKEALKNNPKKVYRGMVAERLEIHKKQKELRRQLRLTKGEAALVDSMLDLAYLKELRKRYVSESLYYFDKVLMEIGSRTYLSLKQVRFLSTKDVKDGLLRKQDLTSRANDRIKLGAWLADGKQTKIMTGKEAKNYHDALIGFNKNTSVFTGMPVSPGIARGPVRIIYDPHEISKVKKGEIIVTIQVVPSMAPAVLRSAGLICDGGHGITTHPAIIAREAGVPCIIQTQFARHVLKDGDLVEVDGYKGIARKVKK
ncbi:MAG: hypothetical protein HY395_01815 [Candidatus Doudnabacteria bacterium]|nr:hypothetical protein [Candidatus Doudnabacteria bacterium]